MSSTISLPELGWRPDDAADASEQFDSPVRPARVMQQGRGAWHVHDGDRELLARARSRGLDPTPATGDWVLISGDPGEDCLVEAVLPRRTVLRRAEAGGRSAEQVIAANVDLVAICAPVDAVNPRRLERELVAVWESGATPVVVLTKADLVDDPLSVTSGLETVCVGVSIHVLSSQSGEGLAALTSEIAPGTTVALIGPSGVGKSTLINALVGEDVLATAAIRADGKGRHTTTSRHLVPLPSGGLLLDTPGMREFAPWAGGEALAGTFADIELLASGCRFNDCAHVSEPGCAVLIAAAGDDAVGKRLDSWRALQRELAWLERRHDARLQAEERRRWTNLSRAMRGRIRP